jgi:hypothetical protein
MAIAAEEHHDEKILRRLATCALRCGKVRINVSQEA